MLMVRNLHIGYGNLKVIKGISFHVDTGEIITIIGSNGSGKTTLLSCLSGLIKAEKGEIHLAGKNLINRKAHKLLSMGVALVPEDRKLFPTMTVVENLMLGAFIRDDKEEIQDDLQMIYDIFPILKQRYKQYAGTLSGGEQQMLAIGRALMSKPKILLLDEPSMGLAPIIVQDIFNKLSELRKQGMTIVLVEQNAVAALKVADRGYVLEIGKILLEGNSKILLNNHDVKRAYLGKGYKEIWE
jgi:branched-chain amino acid transport system ATP-binding protein